MNQGGVHKSNKISFPKFATSYATVNSSATEAGIEIHTVATRQDNYVYILRQIEGNQCVVIDPSDAEPVLEVIITSFTFHSC